MVCVCVCACVRACVRACGRVCVRVASGKQTIAWMVPFLRPVERLLSLCGPLLYRAYITFLSFDIPHAVLVAPPPASAAA